MTFNLGLITRLRLGGIEIKTVHGAALKVTSMRGRSSRTDGPFVPHSPKIGRYLGQRWADTSSRHIDQLACTVLLPPLIGGLGFRGGYLPVADRPAAQLHRDLRGP